MIFKFILAGFVSLLSIFTAFSVPKTNSGIPPKSSKPNAPLSPTLPPDVAKNKNDATPSPQVKDNTTSKNTINISDEVYADLALRNDLNNISIFYYDEKSKDTVTLNTQKQWLPASTVKTYVAMYAYDQIAKGNITLQDKVYVDGKNVVPTELETDEFPQLAEGSYSSIDTLIKQMVTQSDNTAYNALLDVLGRKNITAYIQSLGLTNTVIGSKLNLDSNQEQYEQGEEGYGVNTTTAEDYAKAFSLIKNNKLPQSKTLFAIFSKQKINTMLPLFLPKTLTIAHKTGDLDPLYHDGGIVQDPKKSYILTVFTNTGDPTLVAHISELIYTRDINLIGAKIEKTISEAPLPPLDPLLTQGSVAPNVLGDTTTNTIKPPSITTSDLGIKSSDLSQTIASPTLPPVLIPADSPFHGLVSAAQGLKKLTALTPKARLQADLDALRLELSEAKDLQKRGKIQQSHAVFATIQNHMETLAKNSETGNDVKAQTTIQSISESRFALLSNELKNSAQNQKIEIIKDIAKQAKDTISKIQPQIPKASDATNLSQKPLVGQVVKTTDSEVTVKTAGGQEITVSTNSDVKARAKNETQITDLNPQALQTGTTVAILGTSSGTTFTPTFMLTNVPKEIAAPQPVTVLKVDTKHNTMVVSENGVLTQVNITNQTAIKGTDTNVSLKSIKPGDVVVVHGEPLTPAINTSPTPISSTILPSITSILTPIPTLINALITPTILPSSGKIAQVSTTPGQQAQSIQPTGKNPLLTQAVGKAPIVAQPMVQNTPSANTNQPKPVAKPQVIQSTSIQVVQKKEDVNKPVNPQPAAPKKEESKPQSNTGAPQTQSQPKKEEQKSQPAQSSSKSH